MNTTTLSAPAHSKKARGLLAVTALLALALAGCAAPGPSDAKGTAATMADQVTMTDAFIKEPTKPMETAMYGKITNDATSEVVLVGGSSDVAGMVTVHKTNDEGKMEPLEGGLVIASGKLAKLEPGGNHIMLEGLSKTLAVGDEVTVTLKFKDGSTLDVTAPVKTVAGGDESYENSGGMSGGEMSENDMTHSGM